LLNIYQNIELLLLFIKYYSLLNIKLLLDIYQSTAIQATVRTSWKQYPFVIVKLSPITILLKVIRVKQIKMPFLLISMHLYHLLLTIFSLKKKERLVCLPFYLSSMKKPWYFKRS